MAEIQVLRIGKISSINYAKGTAKVTYEDRGSSGTAEFPFLAWEYWMPKIADMVLVGHLSNGPAAVILGPIWNGANRPYASGAGLYRKELSNTKNRAVIAFDESTGLLAVRADHIGFEAYGDNVSTTIKSLVDRVATLESEVSALKTKISDLGG